MILIPIENIKPGNLIKILKNRTGLNEEKFYMFKYDMRKTNFTFFDLFDDRDKKLYTEKDMFLYIKTIKTAVQLPPLKEKNIFDVGIFLYKNKILYKPLYEEELYFLIQ